MNGKGVDFGSSSTIGRVKLPRTLLRHFTQPEVHINVEDAAQVLGFPGEKEFRRWAVPLLKQTDEDPLGTYIGALAFKRFIGLAAAKNAPARKLYEEVLSAVDMVNLPCNPVPSTGPIPRWPVTPPETLGMDRAPFERLQTYFDWRTRMRHFAGISCGIVKNGHLVYYQESGYANVESKGKMSGDTIVRLFSMTKCLVAAAFMTYVEDPTLGVDLDDPVAKYIPAYAAMNMSVLPKRGQKDNQPLERPITLRQLLTHTSGIGYGATLDDPWPPQKGSYYKIYEELCENTRDKRISNLEEWCNEIAKIPLKGQPGHFWDYSYSLDVLGRVVEVISGKTLDVVMEERICSPLKMRDTSFKVPEDQAHRLGPWYKSVEVDSKPKVGHRLEVVDKGGEESGWVGSNISTVLSAGGTLEVPLVMKGGMVSTFNDYLRFLLMIRNHGELDGVRVLKRETVQLMITNHIPVACNGKKTVFVFDKPGVGYSCLGQIQSAHPKQDRGTCSGEYGWGGLAGPAWTIDPRSDLIVLSMTQTAFVLDHEEYLRYAARRAIHQYAYGTVAAPAKATSYPPEVFDVIRPKLGPESLKEEQDKEKEFEDEYRIAKLTRSKTAKERAILPGARLDRHPSEEVDSNGETRESLAEDRPAPEPEATPAAKRRRNSAVGTAPVAGEPAASPWTGGTGGTGKATSTPSGQVGSLSTKSPAKIAKAYEEVVTQVGSLSAKSPAKVSKAAEDAVMQATGQSQVRASPAQAGPWPVRSPAKAVKAEEASSAPVKSPAKPLKLDEVPACTPPPRAADPSKPKDFLFMRVSVPPESADGSPPREGTTEKARVTAVEGEALEVITEGSWSTRSVKIGDVSVIDESHWGVPTVSCNGPTEFPAPP